MRVRVLRGPFRRQRLRIWHRITRYLAWLFAGEG